MFGWVVGLMRQTHGLSACSLWTWQTQSNPIMEVTVMMFKDEQQMLDVLTAVWPGPFGYDYESEPHHFDYDLVERDVEMHGVVRGSLVA